MIVHVQNGESRTTGILVEGLDPPYFKHFNINSQKLCERRTLCLPGGMGSRVRVLTSKDCRIYIPRRVACKIGTSSKAKDGLVGGFKHFLCSPLYLGKIPILTSIFQMGWFNHQLDGGSSLLYFVREQKKVDFRGSGVLWEMILFYPFVGTNQDFM